MIPAAWAAFSTDAPTTEVRKREHMQREEYEAVDAVNWSTLKHLGKSGEHYLHALRAGGGEDTDAKQRGRVTHLAVFEPERFSRDVIVYPKTRSGKDWDAFETKHAGKEIVASRMFDAATKIANAARTHPMAAGYLAGGLPEHTLQWKYKSPPIAHLEGFEIDCKGRVDFIANVGAIVDLKSTKDASPTGFAREVLRYEHHAAAAFYVDGHEAMTGQRLPFVFVAVEASAPYVVQVYRVPDDVLELGRERYTALLAQLNVCRKDARWPGYAEHEMDLALPRWAYPADDDDVDEDLVITEQ